jgi:hypothetical protein
MSYLVLLFSSLLPLTDHYYLHRLNYITLLSSLFACTTLDSCLCSLAPGNRSYLCSTGHRFHLRLIALQGSDAPVASFASAAAILQGFLIFFP